MILPEVLKKLLQDFGKQDTRSLTLDVLKEYTEKELSKSKLRGAEKILSDKFLAKINASKSKEELLMTISETMFKLTNMGV